jgi:hypothetical protein
MTLSASSGLIGKENHLQFTAVKFALESNERRANSLVYKGEVTIFTAVKMLEWAIFTAVKVLKPEATEAPVPPPQWTPSAASHLGGCMSSTQK